MATDSLRKSLEPFRQLAATQFFVDWDDFQLLERFLGERDQAAFAELVNRHRRGVWRVCRHLLLVEHDAEDAFQATFLVLAMKGRSIRKRQALASWLHGVAYRCAMQMKRQEGRRKLRERDAAREPAVDPAEDINLRELWTILETEVAGLPEKHRAPFVLCCLEGKSQEEAARLLGWKTGTVSGRLARARQELQGRLTRRGIELPAVLGAAALGEMEVSAAVLARTVQGALSALSGSAALAAVVAPNVLTLVKGVSQAMFLTKVKTASVILLVAGLMAGAGLTARQALSNAGPGGPKQAARAAPDEPPKVPAVKPERNAKLRYDGKTFDYWRDFVSDELKAERRIDALRAMGAFGVRGYAKEAAEVIVNLIREYEVADIHQAFSRGKVTPDQDVIREGYLALSKIGSATAPTLLKDLDAKNVRTFVTLVFDKELVPLPEASVPAVLQLIRNGNKDVRNAAVEILGRGWELEWKSELLVAAVASDKEVKALVRSLRQVLEDNPPPTGRNVVQGLVRDFAARFLGRLGLRAKETGPALLKAALDGSAEAFEAVTQVKTDSKVIVAQANTALKKDLDSQFRMIKLLASSGPAAKHSVPALLAALTASEGEWVREKDGFPANFEKSRLTNVLKNRLAIIDALDKIQPDKALLVPVLAKVLSERIDAVNLVYLQKTGRSLQDATFRLLRKIETNFEKLVPALTAYLEWQIHWRNSAGYDMYWREINGAARAVAEIFEKLGPKAQTAMPTLLKAFKAFEPGFPALKYDTQTAIIRAWTKMGSGARDALPVLYEFLSRTETSPRADRDVQELRAAANEAIKAISR